jgi:hypothetical protein
VARSSQFSEAIIRFRPTHASLVCGGTFLKLLDLYPGTLVTCLGQVESLSRQVLFPIICTKSADKIVAINLVLWHYRLSTQSNIYPENGAEDRSGGSPRSLGGGGEGKTFATSEEIDGRLQRKLHSDNKQL